MKGRVPAVAPSTLGNKYVRQVTLSTTLRAAVVYQSPLWQHSAGQGKPEGILGQGGAKICSALPVLDNLFLGLWTSKDSLRVFSW